MNMRRAEDSGLTDPNAIAAVAKFQGELKPLPGHQALFNILRPLCTFVEDYLQEDEEGGLETSREGDDEALVAYYRANQLINKLYDLGCRDA
jgi:hypothetical protein